MNKIYSIYKFTFPNEKLYIGWTTNFKKRIYAHVHDSKRGKTKVNRAINKYSIENISKEIIYQTYDIDDSREKERFFIDKYNTIIDGYNILIGGGSGPHSEETKLKIAATSLEHWQDNGYREKVIASRMGHETSDATRKKIARSLQNHEISNDTRSKISNSVKELWKDPEFRANQSVKRKGRIPWNKGLKKVA